MCGCGGKFRLQGRQVIRHGRCIAYVENHVSSRVRPISGHGVGCAPTITLVAIIREVVQARVSSGNTNRSIVINNDRLARIFREVNQNISPLGWTKLQGSR